MLNPIKWKPPPWSKEAVRVIWLVLKTSLVILDLADHF